MEHQRKMCLVLDTLQSSWKEVTSWKLLESCKVTKVHITRSDTKKFDTSENMQMHEENRQKRKKKDCMSFFEFKKTHTPLPGTKKIGKKNQKKTVWVFSNSKKLTHPRPPLRAGTHCCKRWPIFLVSKKFCLWHFTGICQWCNTFVVKNLPISTERGNVTKFGV